VIHARWGEPVDDPEEEGICTDFEPNPFKLGFCINCQKQHEVQDNGKVAEKKEFKKIARPAVAKTAASALDNPAALQNARKFQQRESDVDLAALLRQRRDILLKLNKLEQAKAKRNGLTKMSSPRSSERNTMFFKNDSANSSLGNFHVMPSSKLSQGYKSLHVQDPAIRGMSKSVSLDACFQDLRVENEWL